MAKICIVGPSKKFFSGISAYTICLASALSQKHTVSAVMLDNLLPRFLYPGKKNVGRSDYSLNLAPDIRAYEGMDWNSPLSWAGAYRFLRREKPDVIVIQWWSSSVAHMQLFLTLANRLKIKAKMVLQLHEIVDPLEAGNPLFRLYSTMMGRQIMSRADAFVVHSTKVKEQAIQIYHLKDDQVFVIPHGIYDSYFQDCTGEAAKKALGIAEEFVILYFGMIRKYKGIPCLVEAFNRLPEAVASNSRLVIAGENWGDEKGLETMMESSPYSRQITYHPEFVPDSEVAKYFSAADVVALPYLRTSGSGVASLAMAFGKPLIISDLENTRESLQSYQGALFVPCGDSVSIAGKILELYNQVKMGKAASYTAPASCNWDDIAGKWDQVIRQSSPPLEKGD